MRFSAACENYSHEDPREYLRQWELDPLELVPACLSLISVSPVPHSPLERAGSVLLIPLAKVLPPGRSRPAQFSVAAVSRRWKGMCWSHVTPDSIASQHHWCLRGAGALYCLVRLMIWAQDKQSLCWVWIWHWFWGGFGKSFNLSIWSYLSIGSESTEANRFIVVLKRSEIWLCVCTFPPAFGPELAVLLQHPMFISRLFGSCCNYNPGSLMFVKISENALSVNSSWKTIHLENKGRTY